MTRTAFLSSKAEHTALIVFNSYRPCKWLKPRGVAGIALEGCIYFDSEQKPE